MKNYMFAALVAVVASGPAMAQSTAMNVYGPGSASCATYLNDRSLRINADGWILGFWTGNNRASDNHVVGSSTDSRGIVAEVAQTCRGMVSASLFEASKRTYDRLKADGR